jgi:hypothetical protein
MPKYLSGRVKKTPLSGLSSDRYRYLDLNQAEPDLGDPLVGPSSVGANPIKSGNQYIIVAVDGYPGERFWIPNQGGLIPGSISVFDEGNLVGTLSSITQLNFKGAAVTASASATGIAATITVFAPGNNSELLFNNNNEFGTASNLTFNNSTGLLTAGNAITVGAGGTVIKAELSGLVGINSTSPTQRLDVNGNIRLTGTIYDYTNSPGTNTQILTKNNLGGVLWVNQGTIRAGAGGTYQNIQFHNSAGFVDGASIFVYDEINSRVGIGSTIPQKTFDVLGYSRFKGQTEIDYLNVTGVSTIGTLGVGGLTTTRDLTVHRNLNVSGITTVGYLNGTSANYTGIVTATKFNGSIDINDLYVTGIATFTKSVGIVGLTTTQDLTVHRNLRVVGIATFDSQVNINNLNVTGVGTFDNIKLDTNTVSTTSGNLIIDSNAGTTQINDVVYVNDTTQSTTKDNGSIYTEGGVGIEKNLNVGGSVSIAGVTTLASSGGITTTGGDLYVGGNLYIKNDIYYDEISGRRAEFTEFLKTKDFEVTGIATIATLGVGGLTTTRNLRVVGISTFDNYIDANGGAYIDNIQIGISDDNTIDTTTGNLVIDSNGGLTTINDRLSVTGISTFDSNATFNANVQFGNANTDTVTFTSRINSTIEPTLNITFDLGSSARKWNNVYAQTFNGQFVGNADTATQVSTGSTTGTTTYYPTFVDSNNTNRANEYLYTDTGITYNPSTDILSLTNLTVSGITTFGSSSGDTVTFTSRINSSVLPSATDTFDLGSSTRKWSNIYANTFTGLLIGNADTATQVSTGSTTGTTTYYPTFVDSNNANRANEYLYTDTGITYNPSTDILNVSNLIVSGISTFGNSSGDTVTFTSRINSNIVPSVTDTYTLGSSGSLRWNAVYAQTFNGQFVGNADTATQVSTGSTTGTTTYYPTFVDSNNANRTNEYLYTDADISYNPSTDILSLTNLTVSGIATFNGNVTLGNSSTDTVTFTSRINSSVLPSVNGTLNLGGTGNRWDIVYANTFNGSFVGNADTATTATYLNTAYSSSTGNDITTRLNSGFWETSSATTTEGWPTTTNTWYHLISSTHSNPSNYYALQLAAPFYTQKLYFRATNGSGSTAWSEVVTSSGDVSGNGIVPVGSVFYFARTTRPDGYLICNGASLSTTTYSALFAIIGYTFGGSGASFNLPDLRGEFIRGWDNGRGADPGRTFGSFQDQAYLSHSHSVIGGGNFFHSGTATGVTYEVAPGSGFQLQVPGNFNDGWYRRPNTNTNGGTETRPRNIALLPCIKY